MRISPLKWATARVASRAPHWLFIFLVGAASVHLLSAQEMRLQQGRRAVATREGLVAFAEEAQRLAAEKSSNSQDQLQLLREAEAARERLRVGDFVPGDQIELLVTSDSALSHTFSVEEGPSLRLPNLPLISIRGLLHSELQSHLKTELARFLREPDVSARALVRIGVLGEVRSPGFYRVAADMPLSDALMAAGGLASEADLTKVTLKRGSVVLMRPETVSSALSSGETLDALGVRAGDVMVVGKSSGVSWSSIFQFTSVLAGVLVAVMAIRR